MPIEDSDPFYGNLYFIATTQHSVIVYERRLVSNNTGEYRFAKEVITPFDLLNATETSFRLLTSPTPGQEHALVRRIVYNTFGEHTTTGTDFYSGDRGHSFDYYPLPSTNVIRTIDYYFYAMYDNYYGVIDLRRGPDFSLLNAQNVRQRLRMLDDPRKPDPRGFINSGLLFSVPCPYPKDFSLSIITITGTPTYSDIHSLPISRHSHRLSLHMNFHNQGELGWYLSSQFQFHLHVITLFLKATQSGDYNVYFHPSAIVYNHNEKILSMNLNKGFSYSDRYSPLFSLTPYLLEDNIISTSVFMCQKISSVGAIFTSEQDLQNHGLTKAYLINSR